MWFGYGRPTGFPTQYPPNKTSVTVDVLEVGLIFSFVILAVSFFIILAGYRLNRLVSVFSRITVSLILGAIIIVGNYAQEWEVGHVRTPTAYKVGTGVEIDADISIKIGFRSVNVTLKADSPKNTVLENETINYNERFDWTWDQGRFGFGPYAGHLQRSFREAQFRGLPLPILWVVDYFVFDGEGLRFGRFYRTAGWYSHIVLWAAFPSWLLTNILFLSVIRYGINFLAITGALQLTSCLIWGVVRNSNELDIPFEAGSLTTNFGSSFYLTLIGGILCCVIALTIYILNMIWPDETAVFFGIDPLSDYEEIHLAPNEIEFLRDHSNITGGDTLPMTELNHFQPEPSTSNHEQANDDIVLFKRRSTNRFGKRNTFRSVPYDEEQPVYGNIPTLQVVSEEAPLHPTYDDHHVKLPPVLPPKRKK